MTNKIIIMKANLSIHVQIHTPLNGFKSNDASNLAVYANGRKPLTQHSPSSPNLFIGMPGHIPLSGWMREIISWR